jgi:hypothetical protein
MQSPPPVSTLLERLGAFAERLEAALSLPQLDWLWRPAIGHWSLTEVLCHLRDVEREVHLPRFEAVLRADNAFLPGVSADDWAVERRYQEQDGSAALNVFLAARRRSLAMLSGLPEESWERRGEHAFFGPTSMHELLNLVVGHDRAHWEQIEELLHRQHEEE